MKAVVHFRYGDPDHVLEVRDIPAPVASEDEVLVRVHAASMHPDIWHTVTGRPYVLRCMGNGILKPKRPVPGSDLSGVVESIGRNVRRLAVGDEVFGECGLSWRNGGTFAEFAAVRANVLARKPANVTHAQAASVGTTGYITMINLRPERIRAGDGVLINGAGGNVGTLAIQLAKARGAYVTGVDHTSRLDLVRTLGADRVIDYTKADVFEGSERYDVIFDVASTLSLRGCQRILNPSGIYTVVGHAHYGKAENRIVGSIPRMLALMVRASLGHQHLAKPEVRLPDRGDVMERLGLLMESGTITPIVAKTFPLSEVPAAIRCLEEARVQGRIVLTP
jgi:NADPH:quinone reductase-like Zn-dependent oxidoreductase